MKERLHKILAHCGVGSRRECETLILQGRVTVNGDVVTQLGTKVEPGKDELKVDGERVRLEEPVYYLLFKPRGYICTNRDDRGRPRAIDLVRGDNRRIYTVGRLDAESEGLILLTNDGNLANVVSHPSYSVEKTYRVTVKGPVEKEQLDRIEEGVWLAEGRTAPAKIHRVERAGTKTIVTITIFEGRNRELRRIFGKVGLRVGHLVRVAIGPLRSDGLRAGDYRRLEPREMAFLRARLGAQTEPPGEMRKSRGSSRRRGPGG